MTLLDRIVIDTNVFISAILLPLSIPRRAIDKALDRGTLLFSEATMSELAGVLSRKKLDRYVSREERESFLHHLSVTVGFVPIIQSVRECRDAKDDKFLEVALNGRADLILTGDVGLLAMHPWRGIAILSPMDHVKKGQ